ncbi:hypothetical protein ACSF6V_11305 [Escherichia coli]
MRIFIPPGGGDVYSIDLPADDFHDYRVISFADIVSHAGVLSRLLQS